MPTELAPDEDELAPIDGWPADSSRELLFTVTLGDGSPKDLTNDAVEWELLAKPYDGRDEAILTGDDSGVTIQRDGVVDPTAGEFRVDIVEDALEGEWGELTQRVTVDPPGESRQSWRGDVTLTAVGETA
mgnify:CR=1 FL=1